MSQQVWNAADAVVAELCRCAPMADYTYAIANWRRKREVDEPVMDAIRQSRFGDQLENRPLSIGLALGYGGLVEELRQSPEGQAWLEKSVTIAVHFLGGVVEWIRARLPGYPTLHVPHIDPLSPRTQPGCFFFGPVPAWVVPLRAASLTRQPVPELDDLEPADSGALSEAVRNLADALVRTEQWTRFVDCQAALGDADRKALKRIVKEFRRQASDYAVDQIEPTNVLRRHQLQEAILANVVDGAVGPAAAYLSAFTAVDTLVGAVVRLIEFGVTFGPPPTLGRVVEGTWRDAPYGKNVRLVARSGGSLLMLRPSPMFVEAEVPSLGGLLLANELSFSLDVGTDLEVAIAGDLLPDSSASLVAGPAWELESARR